ncbi:TrkH family potassium uptake protein [Pullulanibacillus sp. KACC 23026]|uniref:TrkH family potassium uptake protein n=1 Tax=Pullulanibacillus sp. KACC 23026 TaxID=3028315 RepID=UPI0023AF8CB5|nr:TrkH family potassium uptake protein [Pullulanibacillus sp. KACC 23026]WEG12086.1 TrkH family potassium uptake protein [Pullulanibacillus sp. KACC 23026]
MLNRLKVMNLSPPQIITSVYFLIILIGALLLMLPFSTTHGISFLNALFTSTSAMTVTGLAVVDTGEAFTYFGQIVILLLIQTGGLGIMVFAVFIFILLGRKIGLKQRILMQQSINQTELGGIIYLARRLLTYSLIIESIGAFFLALRWGPTMGWGNGIYNAIFHSISAFNNAGFSTWSDNLTKFVGDPTVNIVISLLYIIGGLGFTVLIDLWTKKRFKDLSLQTKLMLIGTLVINVISVLLIFIMEYHNPNTLGKLTLPEKIWAAYFQGTVPRTAGFNTIDIGSMHPSSLFLMCLLMFVGSGSGSTGGGIKLTTFIAILLCVLSFLRGKSEIVVFKRSIPPSIVIRSLVVSFLAFLLIFVAVFILNITEKAPFIEILYETISAFGTVGLTMGLTSHLSWIGRIVIILVMFVGKIGPLTLAISFAKQNDAPIRYPKENILTG